MPQWLFRVQGRESQQNKWQMSQDRYNKTSVPQDLVPAEITVSDFRGPRSFYMPLFLPIFEKTIYVHYTLLTYHPTIILYILYI